MQTNASNDEGIASISFPIASKRAKVDEETIIFLKGDTRLRRQLRWDSEISQVIAVPEKDRLDRHVARWRRKYASAHQPRGTWWSLRCRRSPI
ncbi:MULTISPECIES: hypothetical protein [Ralstonia]|uniref:hypothetical protein n=1 Tax=Ralstonia TaxID=48736 RepID=UPI001268D95C|nr:MULTISPECIES: hypothetical protein [Ralstonia]MBY4706643.1 hypothetical protein [Ralstonia insidiosa]